MLDVVVDTNVLVRAIINSSGSDGKIFRQFLNSRLKLYFSLVQIGEIKRVLLYQRIKRKYSLDDVKIANFIDSILSFGILVSPTEKLEICRDPDDNELLSIAMSVNKERPVYLITADEDLLVLKGKIEKVNILTPQDFLRLKI